MYIMYNMHRFKFKNNVRSSYCNYYVPDDGRSCRTLRERHLQWLVVGGRGERDILTNEHYYYDDPLNSYRILRRTKGYIGQLHFHEYRFDTIEKETRGYVNSYTFSILHKSTV
jgi:hypothetical protein